MLICKTFDAFLQPFVYRVLYVRRKGMEKAGLNITPKEFKELSKLAENAYNITIVIDYFCKNQPEIEKLYNLAYKS